jgi:CRP-like cAMP-binding protein
MALMDIEKPIRLASVVSMTTVSLAVLRVDDYDDVCEIYPQFKENIVRIVKERIRNIEKA